MDNFIKFLDSNFFNTIATLFVGGFAIGLYLKKKVSTKREAAALIIQEIRYAEQQVRTFKSLGLYAFADKLLPTNNWNTNIHLFINDLKESEIDLISRFYSNAAYLDTVVNKISDFTNDIKIRIPTSDPSSPPQTPADESNSAQAQNQPTPEIVELNAKLILRTVSGQVEFVHNTPAVDKLRQITKKMYWLIF